MDKALPYPIRPLCRWQSSFAIWSSSQLSLKVHCAHLGRSKGMHERDRAAHCRRRRPRRQGQRWVRANIPDRTGCAISEPAADSWAGALRSSTLHTTVTRSWSSSSSPPAPASMSRTTMGASQYTRLQRLCDIRAGSRLSRKVHCAHLGHVGGSRARGEAAHRRRRRPRSQGEQWVRANIPECNGCAISEPAADSWQVHCAHQRRSRGAHRHHSRSHLRRR